MNHYHFIKHPSVFNITRYHPPQSWWWFIWTKTFYHRQNFFHIQFFMFWDNLPISFSLSFSLSLSLSLYIYDHHVAPPARISLTLSHHFSLSFIASGRSSGLHPVSSHSCCMYVRVGHPAFARPYMGVHWNTSFINSSLLLQQCPACLVRLTWIVFVMGGRWPYSWFFVGCCVRDLFNIARSILV